jgi:cobalamin biosynthesis protein CobT
LPRKENKKREGKKNLEETCGKALVLYFIDNSGSMVGRCVTVKS